MWKAFDEMEKMGWIDSKRPRMISVQAAGCASPVPKVLVTPVMVKQKNGTIINISSAWAFEPSAMFPTSAVFRTGLAAFTKLFADQYAANNVRMNNVLPGWINSLPEKDERRAAVPMQRYGTVEEIAGTIAFLASDAGAYINGQNIRVDGGGLAIV